MNDAIKILIGVLIGLILVCGAIAFAPSDVYNNSTNQAPITDELQNLNDNYGEILNTSENTTSNATIVNNGNSSQISSANGDSGVIGGGVEFNAQEGDGYYYQINYSDGNFRQYDTDSGELIGSSFDEDQEKLGNTGDLI